MAKVTVTSIGITVKKAIGSYTIERSNIKEISYVKEIFIGLIRVLSVIVLIGNPLGTIKLFFGYVKVVVSIYGQKDPYEFWLSREDYKEFISKY